MDGVVDCWRSPADWMGLVVEVPLRRIGGEAIPVSRNHGK